LEIIDLINKKKMWKSYIIDKTVLMYVLLKD